MLLAVAALQPPLPAVHALLAHQRTTHGQLTRINAAERVTLTGSPVDQCAFRDEVRRAHPGARTRCRLYDCGGTALADRLRGNPALCALALLHEGKGIVSICPVADHYAALAC